MQKILDKNRAVFHTVRAKSEQIRTEYQNDLAGMVFCADCGRPMEFERLPHGAEESKKVCYYICKARQADDKCIGQQITEKLLKALIMDQLHLFITQLSDRRKVVEELRKIEDVLPDVRSYPDILQSAVPLSLFCFPLPSAQPAGHHIVWNNLPESVGKIPCAENRSRRGQTDSDCLWIPGCVCRTGKGECRNMIAAYQRISRADGDLGKDGKDKSNSIENQKELIQRYISCKESLQNVPVMDFVDDGYTGSNFAGVR